MATFAILGYTGGRCKEIAQYSIHFGINDMQIAEDLQLIDGRMQDLIKQDLKVERSTLSREEAIDFFLNIERLVPGVVAAFLL